MGKPPPTVDCPFCGNLGNRSKEHVWAQWMRATEGAQVLLANSHGEQIKMPDAVVGRDREGRYIVRSEPRGDYAKWLPNVGVWVCTTCNNGWMSVLEREAKRTLGPFLFGGATISLSVSEQTTLATWATKSWMAYALTLPSQQNPFTETEYRSMATNPQPLRRARVWLFHSDDPRAHVGMGIASTLFTSGATAPDLETTPDNTAHAYLAVGTVVFAMVLVPEDAPEMMLDMLEPPTLAMPGVARIWPNPTSRTFPGVKVSSAAISAFMAFPEEMRTHLGLPTIGLNVEETQHALDHWYSGVDAARLRRIWERGGIRRSGGLLVLRLRRGLSAVASRTFSRFR